MNLQTIFNKSTSHLLFQGQKSFQSDKNSEFAYIGSNNKMDGIGCLIKDCYSFSMEGLDINSVCIKFKSQIEKSVGELTKEKVNLLCDIQNIHDNVDVSSWKKHFIELAYKYNLDLTVLKTF